MSIFNFLKKPIPEPPPILAPVRVTTLISAGVFLNITANKCEMEGDRGNAMTARSLRDQLWIPIIGEPPNGSPVRLPDGARPK